MSFAEAHRLYVEKHYRQAYEEFNKAQNACSRPPSSKHRDLLDEICMHSAAMGHVLGFDGGKVLQVQPADPATPWLGQGAFAEALAAAEDGDVLQLMPGVHVCTSQTRLVISKCLLIEGLGTSPEEVLLDHRANHPVFQINRACIMRNLSLDMVGFCEALAITADTPAVKPYLQHIALACSGGDGITVTGRAQPLLQHCTIQARHCGLKQSACSTTTLWQCSLSGCENGLVVAGSSQAFLERCTLSHCSQDGIIGLQQAQIHLLETRVEVCGGPGLDLADSASAWLRQADVGRACCGGVFLWQQATCEAVASHISGGSSYAVLLDDAAFARGSSTSVDGPCHISSPASPRTPEQPSPRRRAAKAAGQAAGSTAEPDEADAFCHVIRAGAVAAASPFSFQPMSSPDCHRGTEAVGPLVDASSCLADAAAAAALFPCERDAFACFDG